MTVVTIIVKAIFISIKKLNNALNINLKIVTSHIKVEKIYLIVII